MKTLAVQGLTHASQTYREWATATVVTRDHAERARTEAERRGLNLDTRPDDTTTAADWLTHPKRRHRCRRRTPPHHRKRPHRPPTNPRRPSLEHRTRPRRRRAGPRRRAAPAPTAPSSSPDAADVAPPLPASPTRST